MGTGGAFPQGHRVPSRWGWGSHVAPRVRSSQSVAPMVTRVADGSGLQIGIWDFGIAATERTSTLATALTRCQLTAASRWRSRTCRAPRASAPSQRQAPTSLRHYPHSAPPPAASFNPASMRSRSRSCSGRGRATRPHRTLKIERSRCRGIEACCRTGSPPASLSVAGTLGMNRTMQSDKR
jgi:hypothetical protein